MKPSRFTCGGIACAREVLDPCKRVVRVAAKEAGGGLDRPALAPVLVAPVFAPLWLLRRLEVEVGRLPGRPRRTRQDHAQNVGVPVLGDQVTEAEELQAILEQAGIASELETAVEHHPRGTEDAPQKVLVPESALEAARNAIEALTEPDELITDT